MVNNIRKTHAAAVTGEKQKTERLLTKCALGHCPGRGEGRRVSNCLSFRGSEESLYLPDFSTEKKTGQCSESCRLLVLRVPAGTEKTAGHEWLHFRASYQGILRPGPLLQTWG